MSQKSVFIILVLCGLLSFGYAHAESFNPAKQDALKVIQQATLTIQRILSDPENESLRKVMNDAKAIMIFPSILRAGFFVGVKGGVGVMVVKRNNGKLSNPAFFDLSAVSFGMQAGLQDSEVLFAIMSERGVISIIKERVKLGAELSVAAGPFGATGTSAAATARLADIYSYSSGHGLFLGFNLEGAYLSPETDLNQALYGRGATVSDILASEKYQNAASTELLTLLEQF